MIRLTNLLNVLQILELHINHLSPIGRAFPHTQLKKTQLFSTASSNGCHKRRHYKRKQRYSLVAVEEGVRLAVSICKQLKFSCTIFFTSFFLICHSSAPETFRKHKSSGTLINCINCLYKKQTLFKEAVKGKNPQLMIDVAVNLNSIEFFCPVVRLCARLSIQAWLCLNVTIYHCSDCCNSIKNDPNSLNWCKWKCI